MHDSADPSIAVVGAAGFVGRELLRQFEDAGVRVTAVVRGFPELSVGGTYHRALSATELQGERFGAVINLAYPTSGAMFEQAAQTDAIVETVDGLVRDGGRVIHTSTLAVFGMTLERPISVGPVSAFRDMAYVESKIAAEHQLDARRATRGLSLDIVRFGNIWGPASGAWALPTFKNLLTGRPVAVAGTPGFSNTTDVANAANYLMFLATGDGGRPETRYHHLAEFSAVRWPEWIEPIAAAMGVTPVYADESVLQMPDTRRREMASALASVRVRKLYSTLATERVMGSMVRSAIRRMPGPVQGRLRADGLVFAPGPELGRIEQIVLENLAGRQEFRSAVAPDWVAPIDQATSLQRVLAWLAEA